MNPAQSARLSKEKYPNEWCKAPGCLWRTLTRQGYKPCPKHSGAMRSEIAVPIGARAQETERADVPRETVSPAARSLPPSRLHNAGCLCKHCTTPLPF